MSSKVSEQAMGLYKFASKGLCKSADVKTDLAAALAGAVLGGGIGYAADRMTPKDEDEDRKNRLLTSILTGAALGGLGGYGVSRLHERFSGDGGPTWVERHLDPSWAGAVGTGSAVTGGLAGRSLYYTGLREWLKYKHPELAASPDLGRLISPEAVAAYASNGENEKLIELAKDWTKARSGPIRDIKRLFSKAERARQARRDIEFMRSMRRNLPNTAVATRHSRQYLDAARKARSGKSKAYLALAAVLSGFGAAALSGANV